MKKYYYPLIALLFSIRGLCQGMADTVSLSDTSIQYSDTSTQYSDTSIQPNKLVTVTADSLSNLYVAGSARALDAVYPRQYPFNKKRVMFVGAANITGYGLCLAGLYSVWYKQYPQTKFHTFNDDREWLQVDKVGHFYSAYTWSYVSMETWRWTGISRNRRIWLGGLSGVTYQTIIEVLDGFSGGWGWSWGDFSANIAGSGLLIAQELQWNEQRLKLKFSFHQKDYGSPDVNKYANTLYGKHIYESFLKDYNAQTYWISANLTSFLPESKLPAWLNVAAGYGAEGMFGAYDNFGVDDHGNVIFVRRDIKRYRQWFIAPDVDLTRIKTHSKLLRLALGALNVLKFPTPSLEFSNNRVRWNWIHF